MAPSNRKHHKQVKRVSEKKSEADRLLRRIQEIDDVEPNVRSWKDLATATFQQKKISVVFLQRRQNCLDYHKSGENAKLKKAILSRINLQIFQSNQIEARNNILTNKFSPRVLCILIFRIILMRLGKINDEAKKSN